LGCDAAGVEKKTVIFRSRRSRPSEPKKGGGKGSLISGNLMITGTGKKKTRAFRAKTGRGRTEKKKKPSRVTPGRATKSR